MTRVASGVTTQKAEEGEPIKQHVACPRCAGNKRILDFQSGDRATGEPAGWKAMECPGCGGIGNVATETAAAILAKMEKSSTT